jgi:hypothetical protein
MGLEFKIANPLMRAQHILFGSTRILRILKTYPIGEIHSHCFSLSLLRAKKVPKEKESLNKYHFVMRDTLQAHTHKL